MSTTPISTDTVATSSPVKDVSVKANSGQKYFYGVGRRKASTARAKYFPSETPLVITVNKRPLLEYFSYFASTTITNAISQLGITTGVFELYINGGGTVGQAGAGRLAIAKALLKSSEEIKPILRSHGYLTTDIRRVQPKSYGRRKARRSEQWSKR